MDNNNNNSQSPFAKNSADGAEGEKKPGGTLDLQNISIKTLKDDLTGEEGGETNQDKSGWFNFLAKHKNSSQSKVEGPQVSKTSPEESGVGSELNSEPGKERVQSATLNQPETGESIGKEKPEETISSLDQELEQFKAETEKNTIEAPSNLPISETPIAPKSLGEAENVPTEDGVSEPVGLPSAPDSEAQEKSNGTEDRPALGSFFPPKPPEAEEESKEEVKNKLAAALSGSTENAPTATLSTESPIKFGVEGKTSSEDVGQIDRIKPLPKEGIAGSILEDQTGEADKNPFSTRLQKAEPEKKSLLQSVESALNYSAPPEFSEGREKIESGELNDDSSGQVVDLRKKPSAGGGILGNKRLIMILGGAGGLVIIIIITLALVLGRSSTPNKTNTPTPAIQENKNQNTNPVAQINPTNNPPKPVSVAAQKVLTNTMEINISSVDAINQEIEKIRQGSGVRKQTQLIFLKSDGSAATYQDLVNATGINIPQKVLSQPNAVPALIFADFFRGQTILGLIIPTTDTDEIAVSKMKNWESTMVIDLSELWKGINIDNQGAYFADSQLFQNARFALIDKRDKLSLDYVVFDGYIFVTCGKDSMAILQRDFTAPTIQWEGAENVKTSGVNTSNSNSNTNSNNSME